MWTLDSPNKELKVMIEQQGDGSLRYCVSKHGKKVIEESSMGICTDLGDFTEGLLFEKKREIPFRKNIPFLWGKKRCIRITRRNWHCVSEPMNRNLR